MKRRLTAHQEQTEINVSPLIDMVFILLIFLGWDLKEVTFDAFSCSEVPLSDQAMVINCENFHRLVVDETGCKFRFNVIEHVIGTFFGD